MSHHHQGGDRLCTSLILWLCLQSYYHWDTVFLEALIQVKKFISVFFYQLHMGPKLYPLSPSYIKNSPWLFKIGDFNFLTIQLVHTVTSHAPISSYRSYFRLGSEECFCPRTPLEIFKHVYFHYLLYLRKDAAVHQVKAESITTFLEFLHCNPVVFVFPDSIALSLNEGSSQKKDWRRSNIQTAGTPAEDFNFPTPPNCYAPRLAQHKQSLL